MSNIADPRVVLPGDMTPMHHDGLVTTSSGATRLVFLDFDGTYAERGVVPDAHVDAVRRVRANGHRVFLCTGRPKPTVARRVLADLDGLVGAAGGYVEVDGQVWHDERFPPELGARLVWLLDEHGLAYTLEAPDGMHTPRWAVQRLEDELRTGIRDGQALDDLMAAVVPHDDLTSVRFSKVSCFGGDVSLPRLVEQLDDRVALLPSSLPVRDPGFGELYLPHVTKAVGLEVVAARLDVPRDRLVAAGDGFNDVEMLEHAGVGIAIETGPPELLRHATVKVPGPRRAGLVTAFERIGLI